MQGGTWSFFSVPGVDGTVNFNGLLDSVQFYNQALTGSQISSLFAGEAVAGSLPSTTNVTVASAAALAINGLTQQIGSLSGPTGSGVLLGAGRLIVDSAADFNNRDDGGSLASFTAAVGRRRRREARQQTDADDDYFGDDPPRRRQP